MTQPTLDSDTFLFSYTASCSCIGEQKSENFETDKHEFRKSLKQGESGNL